MIGNWGRVLVLAPHVHGFDVRTVPDHRQEILELLADLWEDCKPDAVFQPSLHDIDQDHQVVAAESLSAFRRTTILGYERRDVARRLFASARRRRRALRRSRAALRRRA